MDGVNNQSLAWSTKGGSGAYCTCSPPRGKWISLCNPLSTSHWLGVGQLSLSEPPENWVSCEHLAAKTQEQLGDRYGSLVKGAWPGHQCTTHTINRYSLGVYCNSGHQQKQDFSGAQTPLTVSLANRFVLTFFSMSSSFPHHSFWDLSKRQGPPDQDLPASMNVYSQIQWQQVETHSLSTILLGRSTPVHWELAHILLGPQLNFQFNLVQLLLWIKSPSFVWVTE